MRALRPTGRRYQNGARSSFILFVLFTLCVSGLSLVSRRAQANAELQGSNPSTEQVAAWLQSDPEDSSEAEQAAASDDLVPPPRPRHHGFVIESGIGALGQLGEMKHVSPLAPWFHLQVGLEPLRFLMLFAEADLVLSRTSYAHPPPPPRSYALWSFGAGLRGTVLASERIGLYAQVSLGGATVNTDVLGIYGYRRADEFNLYLAAELGIEWYQVSPHLALAVHGGIRDFTRTFERAHSSQPGLAWLSGVSLRYTF